jgi:hypothetical protein
MNFLNKCIALAMSLASRGFTNKKAFVWEKQLRVLSCFGNSSISACPNLIKSKFPDSHYCGGCGCGDTPYTQLLINGQSYSKLDYPYLSCPLKMPGFSNYEPATPKEIDDNSRKTQIELYDIMELDKIIVSNPDPSNVEYEVFEKMAKIKSYQEPK